MREGFGPLMPDPAPRPVRHRRPLPLRVTTVAKAGALGAAIAGFVGAVYLAAGYPDLGEKGDAAWLALWTITLPILIGGVKDRSAELTAAAQAHREALAQAARHLAESPSGDRALLAAEIRALPPPALLGVHEP